MPSRENTTSDFYVRWEDSELRKEMSSDKEKNTMWCIEAGYIEHGYGYGGWTGNKEEVEDIVALFTSEELAKDYVEKSRYKNGKRQQFKRYKVFKAKSLLHSYEWAEVHEYVLDEFITDPVPPT